MTRPSLSPAMVCLVACWAGVALAHAALLDVNFGREWLGCDPRVAGIAAVLLAVAALVLASKLAPRVLPGCVLAGIGLIAGLAAGSLHCASTLGQASALAGMRVDDLLYVVETDPKATATGWSFEASSYDR